MKYGNRSLWQKLVSSPFSVIAMVIVVFVLARASFNIYGKVETSAAKLNQAQTNLAKIIEYQADISRKVGYLSTDQGIETEIRTKYHAVKDGEEVAVVVDDPQSAKTIQATSSVVATPPLGFWARLLRRLRF
ncbi:MAG: hypothetical protein A3C79_02260 [Candidatus Taylorbacteria bacterium RIFCSPHIGHO2_02_FULL_45_28]|uniref:Uncharacterized protein n=1 Tax=Candidatus Taylorbacteria bacterium RIFCSPHIGHO2_12_FULL_45_16 TaxID=1802315 RepID=A0A1G2MXL9_9BACT|nr:MAG: hypothetical protein A2830_03075 [Candidatus Taylorbacteria bacterium RIFCSPHIGHO2_01_FULL_44_110]OHA25279.1 MAG: hypothetical protein A3C79_02260 [Candidatus Taylorbacteria bacterium RIFCSPHIGHO2_02_FULL_45_28]OHA28666.1 MAG: hypothetical protein A3F51_02730 [Candidatus Taylorbacteria bacterium RIFCSPHIGHO2_12_FULL_45_16]OHA32939.1 MAG: hypothetical protein A3A23_00905 [Candidatus Taylorbacteria bacterium RIFCSPLOWO2_01_FULL_45_59]OHA43730.1 MAG: hypothetical protein A3G04_00010 [Candi